LPLYMDLHTKIRSITPEAIREAHRKDLEVQGKYGVKYLKYWVNNDTGCMFCLVEAPSKEAAFDVHRDAHGLLADEIYEVYEGA